MDKRTTSRILKLINEIKRTHFEGTGKPEPLKHQFKGKWSRRITDEHRLVYEVSDNLITIISCKYHYDTQ
ncbi:MAG: Txe/YoeB family addiction module toxin [Cytophagales bacterium]